MIVAYTLSRHPVPTCDEEGERTVKEIEMFVNEVTHSWPVSNVRLDEIRKAADNDLVIREVMEFTVDDWPAKSSDISRDLHGSYSVRSNLSVAEGLLVYDGRIVIPSALHSEILKVIHHGHQGITKCNERAKEVVWWFSIGKDIKRIVSQSVK